MATGHVLPVINGAQSLLLKKEKLPRGGSGLWLWALGSGLGLWLRGSGFVGLENVIVLQWIAAGPPGKSIWETEVGQGLATDDEKIGISWFDCVSYQKNDVSEAFLG